jgi:hypothetical protein
LPGETNDLIQICQVSVDDVAHAAEKTFVGDAAGAAGVQNDVVPGVCEGGRRREP